MIKRLIICTLMLLSLICTVVLAEQDGMYTYKVNRDNTVTITKFDWKKNNGDIYLPEMLGNRMVTAIGEKAFKTTDNVPVKITLPENIKTIGEQAFRGVNLTYVNIPLGTTEINGGAFAECSVSRFNVASGHPVFATIENALYNKQTKTLIAWPENKELEKIPDGIINIGDYAFYGRNFGKYAFLDEYVIPSSVKSIGKYAFAELNTGDRKDILIKINLSHIKQIDEYAFSILH